MIPPLKELFALADLHLSLSSPKPMDIFGPEWERHEEQIAAAWRKQVGPASLVVVPGDISWAMDLDGAQADLRWLDGLPGRKVIIRGNHDYWWSSIGKVRRALEGTSILALQNDALSLDGLAIAGTRLWDRPHSALVPPGQEGGEEERVKLWAREIQRLGMSLRQLDRAAHLRVAMVHFPPTDGPDQPTEATRLLSAHGVDLCLFGHLHGLHGQFSPLRSFELEGVAYRLVSADAVGFRPLPVARRDDEGAWEVLKEA